MSAEGAREFVDTNVLVYAHARDAGGKHSRARELVERLWAERRGALSVQILQELFVTLTRTIPRPLEGGAARRLIADLALWSVHEPTASDVVAAIDLHRQAKIAFWDAMVANSASRLGCAVLWSEDLNAGQRYAGVLVQNPFADQV